MKKKTIDLMRWFYVIVMCASIFGCSKSNKKHDPVEIKNTQNTIPDPVKTSPAIKVNENPADFVPQGYKIFEKSYGDLNKDGLEDCILIIKKVDKNNIIKDEYRGELDRNRRGIIILFKKENGYELASKNYSCFSSENEDGGVYYAPELLVSAKKGNLAIEYLHGRYGYWSYTFRYQNSDFELIGYDASSNTGPVINSETSINFSTKKKLEKVNTNSDAESGDEIFESTWSAIKIPTLIKLSEIKDFDELDTSSY